MNPSRSQEIVYHPKLLTLAEDLWVPVYTDLGITEPYISKGGWWGFAIFPESEHKVWAYGRAGCKWNGASMYPDYDWMIMPSWKHDQLLWGVRYGVIPESYNNAIDRELGETVRRQNIGWKPVRYFRAFRVQTGTLLHNEEHLPGKPLHPTKRLKI